MEAERERAEPYVVAVSELIAQLRELLADGFGDVWVEGEIGSLHRSRPGHLYFDLKDDEGQLRAVLFRRSAEALDFDPEEGMQVRAHARLDIYAERGLLQLVIEELRPRGEGALRQAFERLKARLMAEGLFDPAHKRALPYLPRRIGLVTSLGGAAVHDFLRGLQNRFPAIEVLVHDARVQGEEAWRELVRGLHMLDAQPDVDVIVLARGGGSAEDLWTFNREELVRAIFSLETPVVSAIGHEIDWVLCDLVADARAATPTMAAELVVPDAAALRSRLAELEDQLVRRLRERLLLASHRLEGLRRGLVHPAQRLTEAERRLAVARERLGHGLRRSCERASARLAQRVQALASSARGLWRDRVARVEALGAKLDALSPLAVLGRGYSIARRQADGAILKASSQVAVSESIEVRLARGQLRASVTATVED